MSQEIIEAVREIERDKGIEQGTLVRLATGVVFLAEGYGEVTSDFVRGGFARSASEMAGQAWPFWGHPRIAARHRDPSRTVLCARFVLGPLGDRRPPN